MTSAKLLKTLVFLGVAASLALSACTTPATTAAPTQPSAGETSAPPTQPAPTTAPAESPTEAPKEPVELVYWSMWNESEPQGQVLQKAIDAFEAGNPNVTVKVTWNGRENRKLIAPALEGGEAIDLFDTGADILVNLGIAQKYALPIDDYLDQPAVGVDGKTVRETIVPALLSQYPVDGKVVLMPYQPFAVIFFYNKQHFEDAGISQPPATWEEFIAAAEALKNAGHSPITTDVDAYTDIHFGYFAQRAVGCDGFIEALKDKTGESWRKPAFVDMANKIAELTPYLAEGTEGNLYPAGQQQVALGEVSMELNGTWLPQELLDTSGPDFPWATFSFPSIGGAGTVKDVMMGSQGMVISNKSAHPDEAFEFIKYLVSKDVQQAFVTDAKVPASHLDVDWDGPLAEAGVTVKGATKALGWACDMGGVDIAYGTLLPNFNDLFLGKTTPEAFIDKMAADTKAYWDTH
jgi:raffinose/stachyose/melibiose transport system substrate-binding protein